MAEAESPVLTWRAMAKASAPPDPQAPGTSVPPRACRARPSTGRKPPPTSAAIGRPGEYPFTRGLHPTGYRGALDHAPIRGLRDGGGEQPALPLPPRARHHRAVRGLRPAHPDRLRLGRSTRASGEVGRVGVAIDSLEDMETLLDGIPLDRVSTSMTINATAAILLALYVAVARRRGIPEASLSGPCRTTSSRSTWRAGPTSIRPRRRCGSSPTSSPTAARELPRWNTISISGYHIREAGATAPQEIGLHVRARARVRARRARGRTRSGTASASGSRSSSPAIPTSSRRWRSSAPRAGCGRAS